jgi:hypothetical protein
VCKRETTKSFPWSCISIWWIHLVKLLLATKSLGILHLTKRVHKLFAEYFLSWNIWLNSWIISFCMLETATISSVMEFVFYSNNGIVYNISRTSFAFQPSSHVHHEKATLSLLFVRIQGSMRNHCSSTWDVNNSLQCCNKKPGLVSLCLISY